ncbi:hypothetical protein scyTo_0013525, partial [Scyliorhinus torazame]|nr:hypothetical protein [Scyliorhinus torazame]
CGRNRNILDQTYSLVEHSLYMAPTDAQIATELGFQLVLQDKLQDAVKRYTDAMKLKEINMPALTGKIQAEILLGQLEDAEQQLELLKEMQEFIGTSAVREHPLYHLIKARALKKMGKSSEAIATLKVAIALPGVRRGNTGRATLVSANVSVSDSVSVYLELAAAQHSNGEQDEAAKVMQDAIHEFAGMPEETRITIANVDLALIQDDVDTAFSMLRSILPEQPYYIEAQKKLAQIYLHKQKDQRLYISCYMYVKDRDGSLTRPEKAIEVYEQVLKKNPHDGHLVRKIGQALVKTHHYTKAIHYFETALKIGGQDFLCHDLAELLLKLRLFEKAKKVLRKALEHDFKNDLATMMNDVKCLMLLAKICTKTNEVEEALSAYSKAYDLQKRLLKRLMLEQTDIIPAQNQLAASICTEIAHLCMDRQEYDKAAHYYKEGLGFVENDPKMMADLMFKKQEYEHATFYYRRLLERSPGQPNEALKHFNKARKDSDWGQSSIYNMIQICLNPDNEIIGSNLFETQDEDFRNSEESTKKKETDQLAVTTADKLLKEYHPQTQEEQEQRTLLQNSCLMATNDRSKVEKALEVFTEMASIKKDHIPSLLAIAQACMILKLIPRARNQLKRITKINWNLKEAEEFEKSWLLLADIYIKAGKYDLATELLKRCLQYNQSCCKAYEYLGFIMEKEQSYMDAVTNYKLAWTCSNEANPAIGYKLAFNYMKAKMYMHAIDICHKVLKNHPTYPKIQKEVFEKARASLKQ